MALAENIAALADFQKRQRELPRVAEATFTEDMAALRFAELYADQFRFCHTSGQWYRWNNSIWQPEKTEQPLHAARELARELGHSLTGRAKANAGKVSYAKAIEAFAKADPLHARTQFDWDQDPFLLGTPGGTIDLRTGRLRKADPADGITKSTAVTPSEHADCPVWIQFLEDVTKGNGELIRFLQQWLGYSATGSTREQSLVFIYGPGGNGKSVFLNTALALLADYAVTAPMDSFEGSRGSRHPCDLAMMKGARLVAASETEEGKPWDESRVKQLTGSDPITARYMRQDFFTFQPEFTLIVIGNHQPALRNVDNAMRRRLNVIPFTHTPPRPDPCLAEKLKAEWPAILRWIIDGSVDWQTNGLIRPAVIKEATSAYFAEQDIFAQWLDDECEVAIGNEHRRESTRTLYASWKGYAEKAGETPGTVKAFGANMRRRGFVQYRLARVRGFQGIRLNLPMTDDRL